MESKDFATFSAIRRLENHLSQERDYISIMRLEEGATVSLLSARIKQYNNLVVTLNELFGALSDSPGSSLFPLYTADKKQVANQEYSTSPHASFGAETDPSELSLAVVSSAQLDTSNDSENSGVPSNLHESQIRAAEMLNDYEQSADNNVSTTLVEDTETSPDVLNHYVYNQTIEGVPINNDPTQLADVKTATEQDGENGLTPVDLNVSDIMYKPTKRSAGDLIDRDIQREASSNTE